MTAEQDQAWRDALASLRAWPGPSWTPEQVSVLDALAAAAEAEAAGVWWMPGDALSLAEAWNALLARLSAAVSAATIPADVAVWAEYQGPSLLAWAEYAGPDAARAGLAARGQAAADVGGVVAGAASGAASAAQRDPEGTASLLGWGLGGVLLAALAYSPPGRALVEGMRALWRRA